MARFSNGWIKIHRRAILGDIYSNFTRGGLFTVLIGIANMQESSVSWRGKPRKLDRGELVTSITELSDLGETDRRTIDRHLNYLVLRGTIIVEKCSSGTLIKILNFDFYQSVDADGVKRQRNDMLNDTSNDSAHIEEIKKRRKKETESDPRWALYKQFISQYPIKISASKKGFERFKEHASNETDFSKVLLHLARYKKHLEKNKWKAAKQTAEAWFGSEQGKDGLYWLQWDSDDIGESNLRLASSFAVEE